MEKFSCLGLAAIGMLAFAGSAIADELGKEEYLNSCASCHGVEGGGDGPLAEFLISPVPGLRGLSAANDGKFPMLDVIHTIDGRQGTRGHGFPMPVWGKQFAIDADVEGLGAYGTEATVRGRILSIAYFLESIQE